MRRIKFRGKTKEGEWVYGDLFNGMDGDVYIHIVDDYGQNVEVISDTIGQYTGLKDANGKDIYEGDLLRFPPKSQREETNYASFEVFFHDGDCCDNHIGFQMNRAHYHGAVCGGPALPFQPKWTKKMVVDGNVYDNPELIEK